MPTTKVTFDAQQATGLKTLVTVKRFPEGDKHQLSFTSGPETIALDAASTYVVIADVVGSVGDSLSLSYKAGAKPKRPLLTDFKIDPLHVDARPWPAGKWSDRAVTGFDL